MKKVFDVGSRTPVIKNVSRLPYPGKYRAMICGVETRVIQPLEEAEEFCLIVSYKLINSETKEFFDFVETFSIYKGNPRTEDFNAFLAQYGLDTTCDDDIIGITADVYVTNEYIGGYMHPVILYRPWGISQAFQGCSDDELPF